MELMVAQLTAVVANILRGKMVAKDYLPDYLTAPVPAAQTLANQYEGMTRATQMAGGKVFDADATDEEMEAYILQGVDLSTFADVDDDFPDSADGDDDETDAPSWTEGE